MKENTMLKMCGIVGTTAIILGAFGAHALKGKLDDALLDSYKTGVMYHFIHVLAMLICVAMVQRQDSVWMRRAFWFFFIGILFFSGSIYLLATRQITDLDASFLGPITPIGGILFILGWLCLCISPARQQEKI